ncbi:MAG TPA: hypothetical protein VIG69_07110 [Candidatus Methylomirabilis sp.]
MAVRADVERPTSRAEAPAACPVASPPRGRRVPALVGMGTALAACGAYALGWIGETSLLFVVIGFVAYARAKLGWFG